MPRRAAEGIELLADPTRRRIIALIADRVWHPADIAGAMQLSRPAVSRQLRLLTDAGQLRWQWSRLDLRSREYFIEPAMQPAIIAWLAGVDLRNVRPICRPDWSSPMRVHRRRRDVRALGAKVSVEWNHRDSGLEGTHKTAAPVGLIEVGDRPGVREPGAGHTPAMDEDRVTMDRVEAARERIAGRVHRTPMLSSSTAARILRDAGGPRLADDRLYVKAEHLQRTGSFKARATLSRLTSLSPEERRPGVITLSAGNAAQAYAWAGRAEGVTVTVVMPAGAVRSKVDASRGYGAEVVLHGSHVGETLEKLQELVAERGLRLVHPFDDPEVIAGNASAGVEIIEDLPEVDVVVVPVGGGGLISGVSLAVKELRPSVRVYGVEPVASNAMSIALERNEIVRIDPVSVADGLGAPFAGAWTLATVRRYVDEIVLLDDPTILSGLRFAAERMKQVLEPAGAAALAAVLHGRIPIRAGERVCIVASGGNIEISRIGEFLAAAAPLPGVAAPSMPTPG